MAEKKKLKNYQKKKSSNKKGGSSHPDILERVKEVLNRKLNMLLIIYWKTTRKKEY